MSSYKDYKKFVPDRTEDILKEKLREMCEKFD